MENNPITPQSIPRPIRTVLGDIPFDTLGITDAHNHVWIDPIAGAESAAPVLNQFHQICSELKDYFSAGGKSLLDCQPGGCGRNGAQLIQLSKETGVNLIACSGFHRSKYYSPGHWLFTAADSKITDYLISEFTIALEETKDLLTPIRAGFFKIALEATWKETPLTGLEAAAAAVRETGAMIEIHTEKGALAEKAVVFFSDRGVSPTRLVLCHMDKRADIGLHAELARFGAILEYDTFYRPKYQPETNAWPLIQKMTDAGLSNRVVLATDFAESALYKSIGNGPGLASLPCEIKARLQKMNIPMHMIQEMLGGNIARRLAGLN